MSENFPTDQEAEKDGQAWSENEFKTWLAGHPEAENDGQVWSKEECEKWAAEYREEK